MANSIGTNYASFFKNVGQLGKRSTGKAAESKDFAAQYGSNYAVDISEQGLSALTGQKKVDDSGTGKSSFATDDEKKLSSTAQDYLEKLRKEYGDYDFIIADDMSDPQSLTQGSTKGYSVILSSEEIEKMATDEDYAAKILGHVEKAVDLLDKAVEEAELGEGVQFSSLGVSIDDEGNMKLFAQLEKLSEEQQERMEKAKEKREEEKAEAAKEAEEQEDEEEPLQVEARVRLEADSLEELLEKISEIDWTDEALKVG